MSDLPKTMSRREFLTRGAAAAGAVTASLAWRESGFAEQSARRPNIVFILTDDQRFDALGCMGHPFLQTPNMDRVAREGALFDNAFVTTSLCSPSRASFLTGTYAHTHGVISNEANDPNPALPTFPQLLQAAGYETAFVGKWHMAPDANPRPGFDYWLSFRGQGTYENPELNENGRDFTATGYMTDLLTDYAVDWVKQERDEPFCLILSHKAVHQPFTPAQRHQGLFSKVRMEEPANYYDSYEGKPEWYRRVATRGEWQRHWMVNEEDEVPERISRRGWMRRDRGRLDYFRSLLAVDEGLGRLFEALESTGRMDSTVIVLAGDNGFFLGEHGRGDKRLIYEESIRIPFLIRYPKLIRPGSHVRDMALNIDLAPTLLELAGVEVPTTMQGRSLVPLLAGQSIRWRESFLYEYFREGWMPGIPSMLGVRTPRWKYACYHDLDDIDELYDLETDPGELHNLSEDPSHAIAVTRMRAELARLKRDTGYPDTKQLGAPGHVETRPDRPDEAVLIYDFTQEETQEGVDLSGKGHAGVFQGTRFVEDAGRRALAFDGEAYVDVPRSETLDPSMGPWTIEVSLKADKPDGVILAHGGHSHGCILFLQDRIPHFAMRIGNELIDLAAQKPITDGWVRLRGVIGRDYALKLYVDAARVGSSPRAGFITNNPNEGLQIGTDAGSLVGDYDAPCPFVGLMEYVRIWAGERTAFPPCQGG